MVRPIRPRDVQRIIATGGGAVVDPRNRWALYRGRATIWLDGRPEVLAQRLRRSPHVRPLVAGRDPIGTVRELAHRRERFYAAARIHQIGVAEVHGVVDAVEERLADLRSGAARAGAPAVGRRRRAPGRDVLLRASTPIGRIVLGDGIAAEALAAELTDSPCAPGDPRERAGRLECRRASGSRPVSASAGWAVESVFLPQGEEAKRLTVIEDAARQLAALRVERSEPLVAIGGGALGDAAGFLAATYLRGVPFVQVPTTLVAQIDSSIGGKTGVDLPEGKNLLGAFHQPSAVIIDVALLQTLPERQLRAALGEAVKMAALGDERLFELLEASGRGDRARGSPTPSSRARSRRSSNGPVGPRSRSSSPTSTRRDAAGGRITLNLGHSLGHAVEAAAGYGDLLHGEAVAYGLRAACRIGLGGRRDARVARRADRRAARPASVSRPSRSPTRSRRCSAISARQEARRRAPPLGPSDCNRRGGSQRYRARDGRSGGRRFARRGPAGMTTVLVLEGPNLNLVGTREPEIYGHELLDDIHRGIAARAAELGLDVAFFQSNHEGALIDRLHERDFDVAIVNAGGLTHTSVALRDALLGVQRPFIEVHLSDPASREAFRQVNFLHDVAIESIVGQGAKGYHLALESIARR